MEAILHGLFNIKSKKIEKFFLYFCKYICKYADFQIGLCKLQICNSGFLMIFSLSIPKTASNFNPTKPSVTGPSRRGCCCSCVLYYILQFKCNCLMHDVEYSLVPLQIIFHYLHCDPHNSIFLESEELLFIRQSIGLHASNINWTNPSFTRPSRITYRWFHQSD